ncbi:MAG: SPOR domain-containing protein, partial [Gammaproteobacteria bacterium]|nr:SPOR domain-containing protein [Gammaproteobacteria bacterium]
KFNLFHMMTPVLIDSRSIIKSGFIFVLTLMIVFASGFFAGVQRAAAIQRASSVTIPLLLPDQSTIMQSSIEAQPPEVLAAGKGIDVDQPEIKVSSSKNDSFIASLQMEKSQQSAVVDAAKISTDRTEQVVASVEVTDTPAITSDVNSNASAVARSAGIVIASASNELSKIKYTIQVGTYSRLINAESMMQMLQVKQYTAYITDYKTGKNGVRYNVRYGYFADKKSAVQDLNKFKSEQGGAGDGYLVKFSADNIVDVAGSSVIRKPAVIPTEAVPGNISQAEMVPADVFMRSITKTN